MIHRYYSKYEYNLLYNLLTKYEVIALLVDVFVLPVLDGLLDFIHDSGGGCSIYIVHGSARGEAERETESKR